MNRELAARPRGPDPPLTDRDKMVLINGLFELEFMEESNADLRIQMPRLQ